METVSGCVLSRLAFFSSETQKVIKADGIRGHTRLSYTPVLVLLSMILYESRASQSHCSFSEVLHDEGRLFCVGKSMSFLWYNVALLAQPCLTTIGPCMCGSVHVKMLKSATHCNYTVRSRDIAILLPRITTGLSCVGLESPMSAEMILDDGTSVQNYIM